ncbi:Gfo/Idh/MocA family protein [Larkinella terrae]|uniref:Gfo/Idh/MocA family oxidoreductase n=1 Tax=Larkinella terrae TaxID=2025311 RepID=A0A7K0EFX4_9BACT|nr:Gfo/Idh/MocA family oxidoreductase [Larkinella terrae]MRS60461.1 gfo/Idh/MocA family oxidoreductase [Larkinella terrae]
MVKIGIIGMSAGNAHPYSWSAIINGFFDAEEITRVGYPGVSAYLTANRDLLGIPGARVTHVWAQDRAISESIAKAVQVENVMDEMTDLIGQVDAVILGRDDPENHVEMAKPFIEAGVPLFIDKPLAGSLDDLAYFAEQVANGKFVMSCSSMRYATELRAVKNEFGLLGKLQLATAVGKKDWIHYGVHMLEGLFMLLDDPTPVSVRHVGRDGGDVVYLEFADGFQATVHLFMDISLTFQISLFGKDGWRLIEVKNWFGMFRDNLIEFIRSVEENRPRLDFVKTERIIRTLVAAHESLAAGGKTVYLNS